MTEGQFRCCVLASGSTGNAVYVQAGGTSILIDAGIGIRQLQGSLQAIGADPGQLSALLVTHEHADHIKGVAAAVRRWRWPVYASEGTWSQIRRLWSQEDEMAPRLIGAGRPFALGGIVIEPFALSHDAEEPLGFCLHADGQKLVLATDLGYVSDRVREVTRGAQTYILETNHDLEMLRAGPYPWHLKRRILGDKGHLSNDSAADFLLDVLTGDTEAIYLAHLSQENNRPEIARETLARRLRDALPEAAGRVALRLTHPRAPTAMAPVKGGSTGGRRSEMEGLRS